MGTATANNINRKCRNILLGYAFFSATLASAAVGYAAFVVVDKLETRAQLIEQAAGFQHVTSSDWQESVNEAQELCGLALDQIASGMSPDEFDAMPVEIWQAAYQTCLYDLEATI